MVGGGGLGSHEMHGFGSCNNKTKTTVERTPGHYLFVRPRGWWGRYKESEQGLQTHTRSSLLYRRRWRARRDGDYYCSGNREPGTVKAATRGEEKV